MAYPKRFSDVQLVAYLTVTQGNFMECAKRLGVSRTAIRKRVKKSLEISALVEDFREGQLDEAEAALFRAVKRGDIRAICFVLKTLGKDRGYGKIRP